MNFTPPSKGSLRFLSVGSAKALENSDDSWAEKRARKLRLHFGPDWPYTDGTRGPPLLPSTRISGRLVRSPLQVAGDSRACLSAHAALQNRAMLLGPPRHAERISRHLSRQVIQLLFSQECLFSWARPLLQEIPC